MSMDQLIIDALAARLLDITVANGYRTDAGLYVDPDDRYADEDSDEFPRLTWADYAEEVTDQILETDSPIPDESVNELTFTVTGFARVGDAEIAGNVARILIADIKEGMLREDDKRLGGLLNDPLRYKARRIDLPEPGGGIVTVLVNFTANYLEQAGNPDAQLTN